VDIREAEGDTPGIIKYLHLIRTPVSSRDVKRGLLPVNKKPVPAKGATASPPDASGRGKDHLSQLAKLTQEVKISGERAKEKDDELQLKRGGLLSQEQIRHLRIRRTLRVRLPHIRRDDREHADGRTQSLSTMVSRPARRRCLVSLPLLEYCSPSRMRSSGRKTSAPATRAHEHGHAHHQCPPPP
tara:strand:- start:584 stop:1138 length:555 start_codon:yes stop_codon:yes gene_type:complete